MKNKLFILLIALSILALALPSPALAHGDITGQVVDQKTGNGWTHGCTIEIVGNVTGVVWGTGSCDSNGFFQDITPAAGIYAPPTYPIGSNLFYRVGSNTDTQLEIHVIADPGPQGDPLNPPTAAKNIPATPNLDPYDAGTLVLEVGPNAVEIAGFNAQNAMPVWMPYALVIGSLAILSGTVAVARKRRS
ncbi:MAG: hypothetical protein JW862_15265 [Anaerolineales bacterium]|nr:hypothetical protein [Anaerolineales bacterium]